MEFKTGDKVTVEATVSRHEKGNKYVLLHLRGMESEYAVAHSDVRPATKEASVSEFKNGDEVMLLGVVKGVGEFSGVKFCVSVVGTSVDSWVPAKIIHPRPAHLLTPKPKEAYWTMPDGSARVMEDRTVEAVGSGGAWCPVDLDSTRAAVLSACLMDVMAKGPPSAKETIVLPEVLWEDGHEYIATDGSTGFWDMGVCRPHTGMHANESRVLTLSRYAEVLIKLGVKP